MNRRFLNLISRTRCGMYHHYSINRMDTSQLFNRSTAAAIANNGNGQVRSIEDIPELEPLPAPTFSFQPFVSNMYHIIKGENVFSCFGEHKILCADGVGYAATYDMEKHTVLGMPMMNAPKGPMRMVVSSIPRTEGHTLAADDSDHDSDTEAIIRHIIDGEHTESLYVMDMSPRNPVPFEVLTFSTEGWIWRPLPCPHFYRDPNYKPRFDSCAVVDGTTILLSPTTADEEVKIIGTYRFDTVTWEWEKAGDWVLPFVGKAEFLPEFGLWLGLSPHSPHHLCVSSLEPPTVEDALPDPTTPEDWSLFDQTLFNLGSGRFCTVKFFDIGDDLDTSYTAVVFTGVEVVRCDGEAGKVKVIRHESRRVTEIDICSVV